MDGTETTPKGFDNDDAEYAQLFGTSGQDVEQTYEQHNEIENLPSSQSEKAASDKPPQENQQNEEEDAEEEEEEEDEDDVKIVINTSIDAMTSPPPVKFGAMRPNKYVRPDAAASGTGASNASFAAPSANQGSRDPMKPQAVNMSSYQYVEGTSASGAAAGAGAGHADLPAVFSLDIRDMEDKPWRVAGADITDYFNYGFNEESWRTYWQRQNQMRAGRNYQGRIKVHESGARDRFNPRERERDRDRDADRDRDGERDKDRPERGEREESGRAPSVAADERTGGPSPSSRGRRPPAPTPTDTAFDVLESPASRTDSSGPSKPAIPRRYVSRQSDVVELGGEGTDEAPSPRTPMGGPMFHNSANMYGPPDGPPRYGGNYGGPPPGPGSFSGPRRNSGGGGGGGWGYGNPNMTMGGPFPTGGGSPPRDRDRDRGRDRSRERERGDRHRRDRSRDRERGKERGRGDESGSLSDEDRSSKRSRK